ncbi:MAG TPA: GDCCVxC domain-containing (seleno)protein [Ignavibacteria bacterium]|nr:GDCCVxC domain-containing (seleno)protein [Ignavibacteria bacterium]
MNKIILKSLITCPHCAYSKEEIMQQHSCLYFYVCEKCNTFVKPKEGDCCIFCSYGTVKCPPMQNNN